MRFVLSLLVVVLFLNNPLLAQTQEEIIDTPILSGKIVDKIELPSLTNPVTYLVILDEEEKIWVCKVEEAKLLAEVQEYKVDEYVDIYGLVINKEARQVGAEKIEKQSLSREE